MSELTGAELPQITETARFYPEKKYNEVLSFLFQYVGRGYFKPAP